MDVVALGYVEIARFLLAHGANPNVTSKTRDTPLHCAVQAGNADLAELLLEAGADPGVRTDVDDSILDVVPYAGDERERMLAVLSRFGIRPDDE
jgi:ankyrin repeat protein